MKAFRYFIIPIFFSYYIVALFLYFPWINNHLNPLELLNEKKVIHIKKNIYLGVYPNKEDLTELKKLGVKEIITLLNPNMPISRELIKEEQKLCKELNLNLITIPIPYFSKNITDYKVLKNFNKDIKIYIHSYYFDTRMEILKKILEKN